MGVRHIRLCMLAVALVLSAFGISACEDAPTATPVPTPTATPLPTPEPLLHVPGTFSESANSTSRIYAEPEFACGPSIFGRDLEHTPEVLLWTADGSDLVFSHGGEIWTVDEQGTKVQHVVDALGGSTRFGSLEFRNGFHADLSPDGTRLAYTSCQFRDEEENTEYAQSVIAQWGSEWYERGLYTYQIALTELDGSNLQRITHDGWLSHYPVWSPSGDRIAYLRGSEIHTLSADGSDDPVSVIDKHVAIVPPVWSPDGRRLAFVANEGEVIPHHQRSVYTIKVEGSGLVRVGDMGGIRWPHLGTAAPAWHPDGERLAFAGFDGEELFIRTVRIDGSDLRLVWSRAADRNSTPVSQVSWSPDGTELLFVVDDVYIVHQDSGGSRNLLGSATRSYTVAAWSPDGSRIAAYKTERERGLSPSASLAIVNRDGTDPRVLVWTDGNDPPRVVQPTQRDATEEPPTVSPTPASAEPAATPSQG